MTVTAGHTASPWRRRATAVFLALVAFNAAVGILALVLGGFGETQGKILATSLLATAGCVGALVNVPAMKKETLGRVPTVAAVASVIAAAMLIITVWGEIGEDFFIKPMVSVLLVAVAGTYAGLMSLIPLHGPRHLLRYSAYVLTAALTAASLVFLWFEVGSEVGWRLFGVGGVLLAAATLAIPVLARSDRQRSVAAGWVCPRCGHATAMADPGEHVECSRCGTEFAVFAARMDPGAKAMAVR